MSQGVSTVRVRLPASIKEWLAEAADENMRSMSAEVAVALREKMQREERQEREVE